MERLIATGWDVNTVQELTGATALNLAAHAGDAAMVGLLLRHGADPNTQDNDGYYAYGVIVRQVHRPTAEDAAPAAATITVTCTEFVGELDVRTFSSSAVDGLTGARSFWLPDLSMFEGPP